MCFNSHVFCCPVVNFQAGFLWMNLSGFITIENLFVYVLQEFPFTLSPLNYAYFSLTLFYSFQADPLGNCIALLVAWGIVCFHLGLQKNVNAIWTIDTNTSYRLVLNFVFDGENIFRILINTLGLVKKLKKSIPSLTKCKTTPLIANYMDLKCKIYNSRKVIDLLIFYH